MRELKISPSEVDNHETFGHFDLASVAGLTLVAKLEVRLGRSVPLSLTRDYPDIHKA